MRVREKQDSPKQNVALMRKYCDQSLEIVLAFLGISRCSRKVDFLVRPNHASSLSVSPAKSPQAFTTHISSRHTGEETYLELVKLGSPLNLEENLLVVGVGNLDIKSVGICRGAIEIKEKRRDISAFTLIPI